jgi:SAM-dependent methyltransferase
VRRVVRAVRERGPLYALRLLRRYVEDRIGEQRLGFRSGGLIPIETLVAEWRDCHDYYPSAVRDFRTLLDALAIQPHDVFVDYGAGLGRTLALAAEYPFARIVGVEIAPALAAAARANLSRALPAARRATVEVWEGDAAHYRLPADATVLYVYNPFHGAVLRRVLAEIGRSLEAAPRRLRVVFNNPRHFVPLAHEFPWLRVARTFRFEFACIVCEADPR